MDSLERKKLIARAMRETFPPEEVTEIASHLQDAKYEDSRNALLRVLGLQGDGSLAYLVEPFLHERDSMLVAQALSVLCLDWDLTPRYLPYLLTFIRGVPWDTFRDAQGMALACAGVYLERQSNPELLRAVIDTYLKSNASKHAHLSAYRALLRAMGAYYTHYKDMELNDFDPDRDADKSIVDAAIARLHREIQEQEQSQEG